MPTIKNRNDLELRSSKLFGRQPWPATIALPGPIGDIAVQALTRVIELIILGVLFVLLPLSPVGCFLLSGDRRHLAQYWLTIRKAAAMLMAMMEARVIQRNVLPALNLEAAEPEQVIGECTHCGRCCIDKKCVFVKFDGQGHSRCGIYGNWFWRRTNCGRYPISASEIAIYQCPSFVSIPIRVVRKG
jgi:hypothetical protein